MPTYQKVIWTAIGVTVLAILILGYFLFIVPQAREKSIAKTELTPRQTPQATESSPAQTIEDKDFSPLKIDLNQSDPAVRELIAAAQVPGPLLEWSRQKELLRSLVAAVDNVAQGQSPSAQLAFLAPEQKFAVREINGSLSLDPRSYRRYDGLVNVFMSIPDETLIFWYKKLLPTLEIAYKELGYPEISFSQRLRQAIEQLGQVPLIYGDVLLERKILCYAFADVNLEDLSQAQKHMLRLGPQNVARIQKKLRALAARLQ